MPEQLTRGSQGSVLLIDDDQLVAGCLSRYLVASEWIVDVATDSASAEALMGVRRYSVVVMDPYLTGAPVEDRGTLISTVHELQPDAALIVLTAYGSADLERTSAACRATLLAKPQSVLALRDAITAASKQRIPISKRSQS